MMAGMRYTTTHPKVPRSVPRISERDREIATLRVAGQTRAQLADRFGLDPENVTRILDRVKAHDEFARLRKSA